MLWQGIDTGDCSTDLRMELPTKTLARAVEGQASVETVLDDITARPFVQPIYSTCDRIRAPSKVY
jgi:hypothetical protein